MTGLPMQDSPHSADTQTETPAQQENTAYSGVVLLGWMERDQALRFLMEDCWFAESLTEKTAESLWQEWRDRVACLPEREAPAPELVALSDAELEHAARFQAYLTGIGIGNAQVVKIDPLQLVVAQHHIAMDIAAGYAEAAPTQSAWMEQALPAVSRNPDLNIRFTRRNLDTEIDIDLPHAEFIFGVNPQGSFGPKELLGHISVLKAGNRMLLGKGYHRLYGHILRTSGAWHERLCLASLDAGAITPPSTVDNASSEGFDEGFDLGIFGSRPPLFADFFTEGLAMPVALKRKHYQLQVRARWVAIDAP